MNPNDLLIPLVKQDAACDLTSYRTMLSLVQSVSPDDDTVTLARILNYKIDVLQCALGIEAVEDNK